MGGDSTLSVAIGAGIFVVTVLFGMQPLRNSIRAHLNDPTDRARYAEELRKGRFLPGLDGTRYGEADYRERVGRALRWLDDFLGKGLILSPRGFGICLSVALAYSAVFYFVSSLLAAAQTEVAFFDALPGWLPWWHRALLAVTLALEAAAIWRVSTRGLGKLRPGLAGAIPLTLGCGYAGFSLAQLIVTGSWQWASSRRLSAEASRVCSARRSSAGRW